MCCCNHLQSFQRLCCRLPGDGTASAGEEEELKRQRRWAQDLLEGLDQNQRSEEQRTAKLRGGGWDAHTRAGGWIRHTHRGTADIPASL